MTTPEATLGPIPHDREKYTPTMGAYLISFSDWQLDRNSPRMGLSNAPSSFIQYM